MLTLQASLQAFSRDFPGLSDLSNRLSFVYADHSLNLGLAHNLSAKIYDSLILDQGLVCSTFFVPHCESYSLLYSVNHASDKLIAFFSCYNLFLGLLDHSTLNYCKEEIVIAGYRLVLSTLFDQATKMRYLPRRNSVASGNIIFYGHNPSLGHYMWNQVYAFILNKYLRSGSIALAYIGPYDYIKLADYLPISRNIFWSSCV